MKSPAERLNNPTAVVENAARLYKDAKLLAKHERHASAYALAVLALEEIGKVVLDIWAISKPPAKLTRRYSFHLRKQGAISALLLAQFTIKEFGDSIRAAEGITEELVKRVARAMHESEPGRFHQHANIGALDKVKQGALYYDDWLESYQVGANHFQATDTEEIFKMCYDVMAAVEDEKTMRVGRAIYEVNNL